MFLTKKKYKKLERLIYANAALVTALVQQMDKEGVVNGKAVMHTYEKNMDELKEILHV